ncbi:hypothetical protein LTS18_014450, partial [Coniosporium uncinatum]
MSLRPDDRSSRRRQRSKSPAARSRDPSIASPPAHPEPRFEIVAPTPADAARAGMPSSYFPNMSNDHNVTMGGYADLPPEQRPGYVPPTSQTTSPGVQYAPPLTVQSAPWSYTATPSEQAQMPQRNIPTSYTGSAG